jgi:hypothetical protein
MTAKTKRIMVGNGDGDVWRTRKRQMTEGWLGGCRRGCSCYVAAESGSGDEAVKKKKLRVVVFLGCCYRRQSRNTGEGKEVR